MSQFGKKENVLDRLNVGQIENVLVFVSDSLRWDHTPKEVLEKGVVIKTVASSLYTAPSFPSMVTGLYPPRHGVYTWEDRLPKQIGSLLRMEGYTTSLWCETTWTDLPPDDSQIHSVLGNPAGISLEEIEPPFIYVEDDKGGHCPYGLPFGEHGVGGCPEFFKEYGMRGRKELAEQYERGIQQSVERFEHRLLTLEKRGLTDTTLILFTSDHGELLGEYGGLTGHGRPPCPELVYVPTIFVHPSLPPSTVAGGVARHVDLYPTILGMLGVDASHSCDGLNLLAAEELPRVGLNFRRGGYTQSRGKLKRMFMYGACSIWDEHGGHVFHDLSATRGRALFLFKIFVQKHSEFSFMIENSKKGRTRGMASRRFLALKHLTEPYQQYLKPRISKKEAQKAIDEYVANLEEVPSLSYESDEETRRRLEALGYVD